MISPAGMALAALTVMLWILWSDSIRAKRPTPIVYTLRVALYLIVAVVMILSLVRHPNLYGGTARAVTVISVLVGLFGAFYFGRKLVQRR
jgi:hypothetical protein